MSRQVNSVVMLVRAELIRCCRIWMQSFIPPVITLTLYFLIFGKVLGGRISIQGAPYVLFIAPGLIMMSVLTASFAQGSFSIYGRKFTRSIDELLIAPISGVAVVSGVLCGALFRSLVIALLVTCVARIFTHIPVHHFFLLLYTFIMTGSLFGLVGMINGMWANSFDDVSWIPSFVITPLSYTGGVFYSVSRLPHFWRVLSHFNPVFYLISAFRYAMLGISDGHIGLTFIVIGLLSAALFAWTVYLYNHSPRLRY